MCIKGKKFRKIKDLINLLHTKDPNCRYDTKYYTKHPKEFWQRLKNEYQSADNIAGILEYTRNYIYQTLSRYGIFTRYYNYEAIAKQMRWPDFITGISEAYKKKSSSIIVADIERVTGITLCKSVITQKLKDADYPVRPRGGATTPGRKNAIEVYGLMQEYGLEKLKTMGLREICRHFGINAPMFERIRNKYNVEYKRKCMLSEQNTGKAVCRYRARWIELPLTQPRTNLVF